MRRPRGGRIGWRIPLLHLRRSHQREPIDPALDVGGAAQRAHVLLRRIFRKLPLVRLGPALATPLLLGVALEASLGPLLRPPPGASRHVGPLGAPSHPALFSGPLDHPSLSHSSIFSRLHRSVSQIITECRAVPSHHSAANLSFLRSLSRAVARTVSAASKLRRSHDPHPHHMKPKPSSSEEPCFAEACGASVKWAQGKAGEDRVHLVVSEEHGWVFVGIYDSFNGPHATDYLLSNL